MPKQYMDTRRFFPFPSLGARIFSGALVDFTPSSSCPSRALPERKCPRPRWDIKTLLPPKGQDAEFPREPCRPVLLKAQSHRSLSNSDTRNMLTLVIS